MQERDSSLEINHSLPWGIVLTSGSQEKINGGYRLEPDLEGKMRSLAALEDLSKGRIKVSLWQEELEITVFLLQTLMLATLKDFLKGITWMKIKFKKLKAEFTQQVTLEKLNENY
jgi:hypothetical protein